MKVFYKKLHNGEIKIGKNTQLTDNEWLAFAVYYEFSRFVDWQNMAYHLDQTIEGEEGGCSRIICFYANYFYDKAHQQNDDTNKKKTIKNVVVCGDFNVAHQEIDIKNYKANIGNAGFTYEERGKMTELLESG